MSLQSLAYILFLVLAWLAARLAGRVRLRQLALLTFSYVFYWSWSAPFLILLAASSLANYGWGRLLRRRATAGRLWLALGSNLLLLGFFKYLPPLAGGEWAGIVAPVGISFFTFQAISYLLDVYRGYDGEPTLLEFCLYLAFWPTILSGPICRLPEMLPQFRTSEQAGREDLAEGLRRIVLGLFMKVVLADTLALGLEPHPGLREAWAGFDGGSTLDVLLLCLGYGFQIFFDFAGYSHTVIGSARLFGIRLRENFDSPYLAGTISDFWARWHMSLSSWIRDYLFFPLAASRPSLVWRNLSLVFAMVVFGIWHGPRLTFALWGLYHGMLLSAHRQVQQWRRGSGSPLPVWLRTAGSWGLTFGAVTLGWILFASDDLGSAARLARSLGALTAPMTLDSFLAALILVLAGGYFLLEGVQRGLIASVGEERFQRLAWFVRPVALATMLLLVILWSDRSSPFVYVRF